MKLTMALVATIALMLLSVYSIAGTFVVTSNADTMEPLSATPLFFQFPIILLPEEQSLYYRHCQLLPPIW